MSKKFLNFILILMLILTCSGFTQFQKTDPWKEILTMKSGRRQTQDIISDPIHSRSKVLKIRFESELDPKFEEGSFRIGCYRTYGNNSCYETIIPRTDCNYYVFEEAVIYGWELGYSDYQFNVKSDNMNWSISVFEYDNYEKEPYFVEKSEFVFDYSQDEHDRCNKNKGKYPEKVQEVSITPENGDVRLQFYADEIFAADSPEYSIYYTINTNPGFNYSIGYNKGFTIHANKGSTITFHVMIKGYEVGIMFYDPKIDW